MRLKPWEGMDIEGHWGWLPVEGKVVLDVGAEYGSTAEYFLSRGAAGVIAVEGDPRLFRRLKAFAGTHGSLLAVEKRIASAKDWRDLLEAHPAHVAKVDCEGGEYFLLDLEDKLFCSLAVWAIELHSPWQAEYWGNPVLWADVGELREAFLEKFARCGYQVIMDVPHSVGWVVAGLRPEGLAQPKGVKTPDDSAPVDVHRQITAEGIPPEVRWY